MDKVHDRHHRLPRSQKGTNTKGNLVKVPQALHRAWHLLFRNWLPPQIAAEINNTWISTQWHMIAFLKPIKGEPITSSVLYEDDNYKVILKGKK